MYAKLGFTGLAIVMLAASCGGSGTGSRGDAGVGGKAGMSQGGAGGEAAGAMGGSAGATSGAAGGYGGSATGTGGEAGAGGATGTRGAAGAGGVGGAGTGTGSSAYSYHFSEITGAASCATGQQMFATLAAMCAALQSDSVNQSCALAARMTFFQQECPGVFQETP